MLLKWARVGKFKSIDDSGVVEFERTVTCLVGKNESGKTAFLEALLKLKPVSPSSVTSFNGLRDYPRRSWTRDKQHIPSVTAVEACFTLEQQDIALVENKFGQGALSQRELVLSKTYANQLLYDFTANERAAVGHFVRTESLDAEIAKDCDTIEKLRGKLAAVDQPSQSVTALSQRLQDYDLKTEIWNLISPKVPNFLYFDQYSGLPGRFSVPYVQNTAVTELNAR